MRVKCTLGEEMTMSDSFRGQAVIGVFRCLWQMRFISFRFFADGDGTADADKGRN